MDNGMQHSKPVRIPMIPNVMMMITDNDALNKDETTKHRGIVGSLLYIKIRTRPDMSVTASLLGTHVKNPRGIDTVASKMALKCLQGTTDWSLMTNPGHSDQLTAYADAS